MCNNIAGFSPALMGTCGRTWEISVLWHYYNEIQYHTEESFILFKVLNHQL